MMILKIYKMKNNTKRFKIKINKNKMKLTQNKTTPINNTILKIKTLIMTIRSKKKNNMKIIKIYKLNIKTNNNKKKNNSKQNMKIMITSINKNKQTLNK